MGFVSEGAGYGFGELACKYALFPREADVMTSAEWVAGLPGQ